MQLIGLLDSPYVRRVAICLQLLGLRFDHQPISVFRAYQQFRAVNPVVKAPTLICDDGDVLMDSTLIIEYAARLADGRRSLGPSSLPELSCALRTIGLALAACEKSVQIIYERQLRPVEKQHQPWVTRISEQLLAAYELLEADLVRQPLDATSAAINNAGVSVAVAWHFSQHTVPDVVLAANFPALSKFSAQAESLAEFIAAAHGEGVCRAN